jgi:hypothetical protein
MKKGVPKERGQAAGSTYKYPFFIFFFFIFPNDSKMAQYKTKKKKMKKGDLIKREQPMVLIMGRQLLRIKGRKRK